MIKVAHVIKSLELGGAESVLRRLVEGADPERFAWEVISLTDEGPIGRQMQGNGVQVHTLDLTSPLSYFAAIPKLARKLRQLGPDVVQTWMYHSDLLGGLASRLAGIDKVVWGIHAGSPPLADATLLERAGLRANVALSSHLPTRIICCSHETARVHGALGYNRDKMVVITNGFSLSPRIEHPNAAMTVPTILRIGRDHPDKDISGFVRALQLLREDGYRFRGLLVGPGLEQSNRSLVEEVTAAGLSDHLEILGPREDVEELLATATVAVSSSSGGEGLPLVIGEAMAAGTPVVTTDVGDSGSIVDDPDRVVAPRDPRSLSAAIRRILDLSPQERESLGARDRKVIEERWSMQRMVAGYCDVYTRLVADHGAGSPPTIVS